MTQINNSNLEESTEHIDEFLIEIEFEVLKLYEIRKNNQSLTRPMYAEKGRGVGEEVKYSLNWQICK